MERPWFALIESNTTGSGRQFCVTAAERGMRPLVLTTDPGRYPYLASDGFDHLRCDTGDTAAVLAACRDLAAGSGLAGVASSSEYFVPLAAETARTLGLPGADPEALSRCRDKARQREVLAAAGLPVPRFGAATTPRQARDLARLIGLPVVVKPTTGSGSSGVRLCRTEDEAAGQAGDLLAVTTNERGMPVPAVVLVEEHVTGPEFSVETFDGRAVEVVGKHLGPTPYFVEIGHDVPASAPAADLAALREVAERAATALGVAWGATHTELRMTAAGPVVIEVNPRLAGGMIPTLIDLASGIDLVDLVVARGSGQEPSEPGARAGGAAIRFLVPTAEGVLDGVAGLAEARDVPGVHLVRVTAGPGTRIRLTRSFRDRIGYAIATGPDAGAAAERALSRIRLRLSRPAPTAEPSRPV